jgi:protein TonB
MKSSISAFAFEAFKMVFPALALALMAALAQTPASGAPLTETPDSQLEVLKQVEPDYPAQARTFRIQGSVRLHALVGTDGKVRAVEVLEGHPALTQAAVRAVEKWEYAPLVVRSRAMEAPTQVVVNFSFAPE